MVLTVEFYRGCNSEVIETYIFNDGILLSYEMMEQWGVNLKREDYSRWKSEMIYDKRIILLL